MDRIIRILKHLLVARPKTADIPDKYPADFDVIHKEIYDKVVSYTMAGPERIYTLIENVRYIVINKIDGAFVECGVWKGGCAATIILSLLAMGRTDREIYLYDTFETMSEPTKADMDYMGNTPAQTFKKDLGFDRISDWKAPGVESVKTFIFDLGYPADKIHFIKGKVENTIPNIVPDQIALLRLDTDWYESTKHELVHLYPLLKRKGILIIDDYGHWQGAKQATNEFFEENGIYPLLNRVDYTCRQLIKM